MIKYCLSLTLVAVLGVAHASSTDGLFICDDGTGVKNIVTVAQKNSTRGRCEPYKKGALGADNNAAKVLEQAPEFSASATSASSSATPLFNTTVGKASVPASSTPSSSASESKKKGEDKKADSKTSKKEVQIYYCPTYKGGEVIEATEPPRSDCRSYGTKAEVQDPRKVDPKTRAQETPAINKSKPSLTPEEMPSSTQESTGDIYQCKDKNGELTYVSENQKEKFSDCKLFSRSFATSKQRFIEESRKEKSLLELAQKGANKKDSKKKEEIQDNAIRCVGAGTVTFNGQVKEYGCATRSFDFTPGTSGGEIVLGDQRADIAAHRKDYFSDVGSCGGTITSPEGRILHLEPTKDCPESFKIEATRIAQAYIKTISVNVSGAFLERQRKLAPQVNKIAAALGVDPFLVHAVISAESAYKSNAVSHAGAQGLMQLMPATARRFGVADPFHTGENIRGGTTYLRWLLKEFNGNMQLAIAGYNAGEGNVKKYGYKIPPFIETRAYVPKVMEYYRKYKNNPSLVGL